MVSERVLARLSNEAAQFRNMKMPQFKITEFSQRFDCVGAGKCVKSDQNANIKFVGLLSLVAFEHK